MFVPAGAGFNSRRNQVARENGLQGRIMWLDADANLTQLSTRDGVADTVAKCKAANINTIIVDVKPLSGYVLYNSKIAPRLADYPRDYDLLAAVIEEGHKAGIAVHAAVNVFCEGSHKTPGGPAFTHPEWQCVQYETPVGGSNESAAYRLIGSSEASALSIFVNPLNPQVREYALSIIREICENYPIDGFVLDRLRYPNLYADFSDLTRSAFEEAIGSRVGRWPEDIFTRESDTDMTRGPLFKDWLKFRSQTIRDFLAEARGVVKTMRPEAQVGIYVGSWYPLYYDVGVNWASPKHLANYDWWPEGYEHTGYADLLDYICTGCYYEQATRQDAIAAGLEEWRSVEAAADESINAVEDATWVYGSLYLMQYKNDPERFREAIEQCLKNTQGCMFFDLVYVRDYNWWDIIRDAFPSPAKSPHE